MRWTLRCALLVEVAAAIIVTAAVLRGSAQALMLFVRRRDASHMDTIRLGVARRLALALEFELGSDILRTAVAPSWNEIGKLGAIIVFRTALNFFLQREIETAGVVEGEAA